MHGAGRLYISQYRAAMRSESAGVYTAIYGQQSVSWGIRAADVVLCVVTADETGGCCMLYKVFPPKAVFSIGMSALLFLFGFVISCQMFYLGLSGVWFLLLCLFPHYLIYLGMLYYLAAEARKVGEDKNKKRMAAMILILTFFVGILSESILSKIFLKNFLQYIGM